MSKISIMLIVCIFIAFFSCSGEVKGSTLLHWAAQEGHIDVLSELLSLKNTRLNQLNKKDETALLLALQNEQSKAGALLVDNGASMDFTDSRGWNYLHWAAFNGSAGLVKKYIKNPEK